VVRDVEDRPIRLRVDQLGGGDRPLGEEEPVDAAAGEGAQEVGGVHGSGLGAVRVGRPRLRVDPGAGLRCRDSQPAGGRRYRQHDRQRASARRDGGHRLGRDSAGLLVAEQSAQGVPGPAAGGHGRPQRVVVRHSPGQQVAEVDQERVGPEHPLGLAEERRHFTR
jgi:hypothetical protein